MRGISLATSVAVLLGLSSCQTEPGSLATNMLKLVFSGSQVEPKQSQEQQPVNLLETISLSYAGNLDLANTITQGGNIARTVARALGSLLDLKMVRSMVEATVEALGSLLDLKMVGSTVESMLGSFLPPDSENEIMRSRSGMDSQDNVEANNQQDNAEDIKEGITMMVGAVIGQQECWQKTACKAGEYGRWIPGKDFLLIVLGRVLPKSWESGVKAATASATYNQDCIFYECSTEEEGTQDDA